MNLIEDLRALSKSYDEESSDYWRRRVLPQLPKDPFPQSVIDEIVAGLDELYTGSVLVFLAEADRREIAPTAVRLAETAVRGISRLELAYAAARCGDARGYALLEKLYIESLETEGKKNPRTVPPEWVTLDTLIERLGTPAAVALNSRLVALHKSRRTS